MSGGGRGSARPARWLALAAGWVLCAASASAQSVEPASLPASEVAAPAPAPAPEPAAVDAPDGTAVVGAPASAPPAVPPRDRITFELKVPAEKGGGIVRGVADTIESAGEESLVAAGEVEIEWKDTKIAAERIVYHQGTARVEAEGDVVVDQGPQRLTAERLEYDLEQGTGTFFVGTAMVEPDYYFSGARIDKTGETSYVVEDGVFTSCTGDPTADWSFRTSSARVDIGGYARVKHMSLRVKKLPVFYWPYMLWPAKTERTSGLLIPNVGYSDRRGSYLGLAYYQTLGPSFDATLYADGWAEGFWGAGEEFRYRPTEETRGSLTGYYLNDRDLGQAEWRAEWSHVSDDLPWNLRGVVDVEHYSDYEFFRSFERSEGDNTKPWIYSNAFLSGSWGAHSLNLLVDRRESFLSNDRSNVQEQLPKLEYRLRKRRLGELPLYLSVETRASLLGSSVDGSYDAQYGRFDLFPQLTLPIRTAPWLSLAVTGGGRVTWWGDSYASEELDPTTSAALCDGGPLAAGDTFCGDSITRAIPVGAVDLIGPSFSRVFEGGLGNFAKVKHVIEPRWSYGFLGEYDDAERVPRFDEVDNLRTTNALDVALVQRFLGKRRTEDGSPGEAYEFLSFEVARAYSFDSEAPLARSGDGTLTEALGPYRARLRFNPSRDFSLDAKATYSALFSGLESTSLTGSVSIRKSRVGLTWFTKYDEENGETTSDQVRLSTSLQLVPGRLKLDGQVNYDLVKSEILQQRYFLNYTSQCWSVRLEAHEQVLQGIRDRDYRFALTLKNVGTFLDLSGGGDATVD